MELTRSQKAAMTRAITALRERAANRRQFASDYEDDYPDRAAKLARQIMADLSAVVEIQRLIAPDRWAE